MFSSSVPLPRNPGASSRTLGRVRALSTSATKQDFDAFEVSKLEISNGSSVRPTAQSRSPASLRTPKICARSKRAQSLDSSLDKRDFLGDVSDSKTRTILDEPRRGHLAKRVSSPGKDAAIAQQLVEIGQLYWNISLRGDRNPFNAVRNCYSELLLLVKDILLRKKSRASRKFRFVLSDANTQIKCMYREINKTMNLLRHVWVIKMQSKQVRYLRGYERLEFQKILDFNVYRYRVSELSRLISQLQLKKFDLGTQILASNKLSGIRGPKRLRYNGKRCSANAFSHRSIKSHNDLMVDSYMRSNCVKAPIKAWWSAQEFLRASDVLQQKPRGFKYFWEAGWPTESFSGKTRAWHYQDVKTKYTRTLIKSMKKLDRALVWYTQELIRQWAKFSPDQITIAISGLEERDGYHESDEGFHAPGEHTVDATDDSRLLGRTRDLELAHSDPSCEPSSSNLVVGLNIQATHMLAQQHASSLARPAFSTPHDFWINPVDSAKDSTNTSRCASKDQGLNHIARPKDTAPSGLKADIPVEVTEEPCKQHLSPLGYHIPAKTLADAKLACPNTRVSYWQYTLYQSPTGEKVKVHYCKSKATTERIAQLFVDEEVLGFDIEWKPQALATEGVKKNVALIQIASEERIALFHIARYWEDEKNDNLVAPTLKKIMESSKITKVGVSIKADCTRLRKFMGINSCGLLELSHLYKLVKFSQENVKMINKKLVSLSQQVEEHLQIPMWKGEVRSSDWSQELDYEQIYCKCIYIYDNPAIVSVLKLH